MRSYLLFFFATILFSCGNTTYENYHSFNHMGWSADSIIEFKYNIIDTAKEKVSEVLNLNSLEEE